MLWPFIQPTKIILAELSELDHGQNNAMEATNNLIKNIVLSVWTKSYSISNK